jgi:peroxiredoxin (alkyl hydroperoxide reductase subunit C)
MAQRQCSTRQDCSERAFDFCNASYVTNQQPEGSDLLMTTIGEKFPAFDLQAVISDDPTSAFGRITDQSDVGKWKVIFFWPKDFTFVCPTEIAAFASMHAQFLERDAVVYGASTDSEYVHLAWRQAHPDLKNLPFPMLSDIKRELSTALGVLHATEGVCLRATFIVDPEGIIRFVSVNDLNVGRNPAEVMRVLDALQTEELCPCNWKKGDAVLAAA